MWLLADAPNEKQLAFKNYIMELSPLTLGVKHEYQKSEGLKSEEFSHRPVGKVWGKPEKSSNTLQRATHIFVDGTFDCVQKPFKIEIINRFNEVYHKLACR